LEKLPIMQDKILRFIQDHLDDNNMPPTVREIGEKFGIKPATVFAHLKRMEKKGVLRRSSRNARSIELLVEDLERGDSVPILGRVPAGTPLTAVENIEGHLPVNRNAMPKGRLFALRVVGESMIEAGILDGDLVVVRQQPKAENGETVVAMVGDEATVKRFYREKKQLRLQPANRNMAPMIYDASSKEVGVVGKVIGVYRELN